jgi:flagellar biosynthesis protein FliR
VYIPISIQKKRTSKAIPAYTRLFFANAFSFITAPGVDCDAGTNAANSLFLADRPELGPHYSWL